MDWVQGFLLGIAVGLFVCRAIWIWDNIRKEKQTKVTISKGGDANETQ